MTAFNQIAIPELYVSSEAADKLRDDGGKLPGWTLTPTQANNLELLMNGGFFPLRGFMTQADCDAVALDMRLRSGAIWPVPVLLEVSDRFAAQVEPGDDVALRDGRGVLAILSVTDQWKPEGESFRLGGKVKGIQAHEEARPTPNRLRAFCREHDLKRVEGHFDKSPDGADRLHLSAGGDAGPAMAAIPLMIDFLADGPQRRQVLQCLVARNYGATHVAAPYDSKAREMLKEIGLNLNDSA